MGLEGNRVNVTSSYLVNRAVYDTVDSEVLISKSTWPLKLSGFVFAGLLIVGRSASYGDVTWTPTYHAASSPLQVLMVGKSSPPPNTPEPKSNGNIDPSGAVKRSAAEEVLAFNAGDSGDGGGHDGNHSHDGKSGGGDHSTTSKSQHSNEKDSQGSAHSGAAGTASGSQQSSGQKSGAAGTAAGSRQWSGQKSGAAGTAAGSQQSSGQKSGAAGTAAGSQQSSGQKSGAAGTAAGSQQSSGQKSGAAGTAAGALQSSGQ